MTLLRSLKLMLTFGWAGLSVFAFDARLSGDVATDQDLGAAGLVWFLILGAGLLGLPNRFWTEQVSPLKRVARFALTSAVFVATASLYVLYVGLVRFAHLPFEREGAVAPIVASLLQIVGATLYPTAAFVAVAAITVLWRPEK